MAQDESGDREPVEVRRGEGGGDGSAPQQFLWRGRLFMVRTVLDHWTESGTWCLAPVVRAGSAGFVTEADARPRVLAVLDAEQALVAVGEQRDFWLVEAAAGRHAAAGVYELSCDQASTQWALAAGPVRG